MSAAKNGERKHESLGKMRAFWQAGMDPESQEKWTQTEWLSCENKDVMEGIVHMKSKYKKARAIFDLYSWKET